MRIPSLLTIALLMLPAAALTEEFKYGLRSQVGWTDNVYGTGEDATIESAGTLINQHTVGDSSTRISPWGEFTDQDGEFTWTLRYQPTYEYYVHESELSDFDHDAKASMAWRVADRTTLFVSEAFQQYRSVVRFNENLGSPTDPAALRGQRDEILGSLTTAGMRHMFTRVDSLLLSATYNLRDYENEGTSDRSTFALGGLYLHSLSPRTSIGARASWIQQTFERQLGGDSVTDYYNLSAVFEHRFSPTLSLELSGGPTLIDSGAELVNFSPQYGVSFFGSTAVGIDADTCRLLNPFQPFDPDTNPRVTTTGFGGCGVNSDLTLSPGELEQLGYPRGNPLVPGSSAKLPKLTEFSDPYTINQFGELEPLDATGFGDSEVTYFARAALIKDWERWHAELAYERSNDDSGSFGASSVQDSLELSLRWEPTPLWTVSLVGVYTMIDQASDIAVPSFLVVANEPVPPGIDNFTQIATVQRLVVDTSDNALSYDAASVSLTANRRLTAKSSLFAALYWYRQKQVVDLPKGISANPLDSFDGESVSRWKTLTLWFGIEWHFDTIKF